jgi:tRNA-binding protein
MIRYDDFEKVDMRIGTILKAELNPRARKPAYSLTIDFGPLGKKTSSAQITDLYTPEDLTGRQVVAVVNFPPKVIAGVSSEVLVLGVDGDGGVALLGPERTVTNGKRIY